MSAEHFQTFLTCDMRTAPDKRSAEYAERGKGEGLRWADSFGPNANPEARGGWSECYLYVHNALEICARTVDEDVMTGLTGDHPDKRQQLSSIIRAVAHATRELALDAAYDGCMDDERWAKALQVIQDVLTPNPFDVNRERTT